MDVVGVMATYLPVVRVCTALSREVTNRFKDSFSSYMHKITITVILAKHCIKLPDDGCLMI